MTIRALGGIAIVHDGEARRITKAQCRILAILVAAGPSGLGNDRLADQIWGDDLRPGWDANLRRAISRMRRKLDLEAITSSGGHYSLDLPVDQVDVWQLRHHVRFDLDEVAADRLRTLLADEPFPGIGESSLVSYCIEEIEAARVDLAARVIASAPERIDAALLATCRRMAITTWSTDLLRAVVDLHLAAEHRAEAEHFLRLGVERLERELEAPVDPQLRSLLESLAPDASDRVSLPVAPRVIGAKPSVDRAVLVGRDELITTAREALDSAAGLLITGDSGAGKTVLAEQLARDALLSGRHVVWVVGQRGSSAAFAPIIAVVPDFGHELALDVAAADSLSETRRWEILHQHLDRLSAGAPLTLVFDDAQWLDSNSAGFLEFLARRGDDRIDLVAVGRADVDADAWTDLADRLRRSGLFELDIPSFARDQIAELSGLLHPSSTSRQRFELADLLVANRATVPAVAAELVATADTSTLALPLAALSGNRWSDAVWTESVSSLARDIAAVAALHGVTWRFAPIVEATKHDEEAVLDAIDELLDHGLIVAEARPDEFSFRHALIQDAFAATLDPRRARELHAAAARQAETEGRCHDQARHLLAAGPVVEPRRVMCSLVKSGDRHLDSGSWLEAVQAYAGAERVTASPLDAATMARQAHAIERSGGDASAVRLRAFERARAEDDSSLMLQVVVEGVDPGEMLEADAQRVALLEQIPRQSLETAERHVLDATLCRELGLSGQHERAHRIYSTMHPMTPDETAAAWLAIWTSLIGTPPASWPPINIRPDEVVHPINRARLRNTNCERHLMTGDRTSFDAELAELTAEEASRFHPTRRWQHHLLRSLRAFMDGELALAAEIADAGLTIGQEHGLAGAFAARTAQVFAEHWIRNRHGDLAPILESAAPDVRISLLATAARAAALAAADGQAGQARLVASEVFDLLDATTQAVHAASAVLLAGMATHLTDDQRVRIREILRPHVGGALIVGAGVAHLGPARRAFSQVVDDQAERIEHLQLAIAEADAWMLPIWSIRCRIDLAAATEDPEPIERAHRLAEGTELEPAFFI